MTDATFSISDLPDELLPETRPARPVRLITTTPEPAIGETPRKPNAMQPVQAVFSLAWRAAQLPVLTALVVALLVFSLALIGFRDRIAGTMPWTADLYAAIGLSAGPRLPVIEAVKTTMIRRGGMPTLAIQGKLTSRAPQAIDVPRLNFAILNARGDEIVTWSTLPDRDQLAAGASMEFASHYTVPPGNAREVVVRFSSRGTAVAGPK